MTTFVIRNYVKTVTNPAKLHTEMMASTFSAKFDSINFDLNQPLEVHIYLISALTGDEEIECDGIVANFVDYTTEETLALYLDDSVRPFVDGLFSRFAAENIALGITASGMTGHVLGLFEKPYDIRSNSFPFSLRSALDTGSLHEAIAMIDYLLVNQSEYYGMAPFVTTQRLTAMKNEMSEFLV